ncbi:hypothetical protein BG004_002575 [Podila humilis]|nr:hypothetical protein BG004_002575 [Podila humilis]
MLALSQSKQRKGTLVKPHATTRRRLETARQPNQTSWKETHSANTTTISSSSSSLALLGPALSPKETSSSDEYEDTRARARGRSVGRNSTRWYWWTREQEVSLARLLAQPEIWVILGDMRLGGGRFPIKGHIVEEIVSTLNGEYSAELESHHVSRKIRAMRKQWTRACEIVHNALSNSLPLDEAWVDVDLICPFYNTVKDVWCDGWIDKNRDLQAEVIKQFRKQASAKRSAEHLVLKEECEEPTNFSIENHHNHNHHYGIIEGGDWDEVSNSDGPLEPHRGSIFTSCLPDNDTGTRQQKSGSQENHLFSTFIDASAASQGQKRKRLSVQISSPELDRTEDSLTNVNVYTADLKAQIQRLELDAVMLQLQKDVRLAEMDIELARTRLRRAELNARMVLDGLVRIKSTSYLITDSRGQQVKPSVIVTIKLPKIGRSPSSSKPYDSKTRTLSAARQASPPAPKNNSQPRIGRISMPIMIQTPIERIYVPIPRDRHRYTYTGESYLASVLADPRILAVLGDFSTKDRSSHTGPTYDLRVTIAEDFNKAFPHSKNVDYQKIHRKFSNMREAWEKAHCIVMDPGNSHLLPDEVQHMVFCQQRLSVTFSDGMETLNHDSEETSSSTSTQNMTPEVKRETREGNTYWKPDLTRNERECYWDRLELDRRRQELGRLDMNETQAPDDRVRQEIENMMMRIAKKKTARDLALARQSVELARLRLERRKMDLELIQSQSTLEKPHTAPPYRWQLDPDEEEADSYLQHERLDKLRRRLADIHMEYESLKIETGLAIRKLDQAIERERSHLDDANFDLNEARAIRFIKKQD